MSSAIEVFHPDRAGADNQSRTGRIASRRGKNGGSRLRRKGKGAVLTIDHPLRYRGADGNEALATPLRPSSRQPLPQKHPVARHEQRQRLVISAVGR